MSYQYTDTDDNSVTSLTSDFTSLVSEMSDITTLKGKAFKSVMLPDLSTVGVVGREDQIFLLREAYDAVCIGPSKVVSVHGISGSGKSRLVETLRDPVSNAGGYFCSGKFDALQKSDPYSAIVQALSDLCDLIAASDQLNEMRASINDALGDEIEVLCQLISHLRYITGTQSLGYQEPQSYIAGAFVRFKSLSTKLVRALATLQHPICIVLDDIQFADKSSLEVIQTLMMDPDSNNVLIIVVYRDEGDRGFLETIGQPPLLIDISVDPLDIDSVNDLLSTATRVPSGQETLSLARVLLKKTGGVSFYLLSFLETLIADGFFSVSPLTLQWQWNLERIEKETSSTENVVDALLNRKMQRLSDKTRELLELTACLGFMFEFDTLLAIVRYGDTKSVESVKHRLELDLNILCCEGFIDRSSKKHEWKFAHDKVTEYLRINIADTDRAKLHLQIGQALQMAPNLGEESITFLIADQLIWGSSCLQNWSQKIGLLQVSIQAAKLAMAKSAFQAASKYLQSGLSLVDRNDLWKLDYSIALETMNLLAEVEHICGRYESSNQWIDEILLHAQTSACSLKAYLLQIDTLGTQNRLEDAIILGILTLRRLGEGLPSRKPNKCQVFIEFLRTAKDTTRITEVQIMALPTMTCIDKLATMRILARLSVYALILRELDLVVLFCMRMVRITLKHGFSKYAPQALPLYGILHLNRGNEDEAYRLAQLALKLLKRLDTKEGVAETLINVYATIYCSRNHVRDGYEPFMMAYRAGRESGNPGYYSLLGARCAGYTLFFTGAPLPEVQDHLSYYCASMIEYGHESLLSISLPAWQACENLQGKSNDPLLLVGEVMDEHKMLADALQSSNIISMQVTIEIGLIIACFFENWDLAVHRAMQIKVTKIGFSRNFVIFFATMAFLGKYRVSGNRTFLQRAQRNMKGMEREVTKDNPTFPHMLLFLKAELLSMGQCKFDKNTVIEAFNSAITTALKDGYPHHAALAHERLGTILVEDYKDQTAKVWFTQAIVLYGLWGAVAKQNHARAKCDAFFGEEKSFHAKVVK